MSPQKVKPEKPGKNGGSANSANNAGQENGTRVLGIVFILGGVLIILLLIGAFVISKLPYRVDPNLPIPTLDELADSTNDDEIDISGTVLPEETVALYRDGDVQRQEVTADEDGDFVFENVELEDEGDYSFEAAAVSGGLFKKRSEKSNKVTVDVDRTPPSNEVSVEYEEQSNSSSVSISGTAEKGTIVILEGDTDTYDVEVDNDGTFKISVTDLQSGKNAFKIRVKDAAGNEVLSDTTVEITYEPGDVNGEGVVIGPDGNPLPESAGELDAAMEFLMGNKLMLGFALIALAVFSASSATAYIAWRKNSK